MKNKRVYKGTVSELIEINHSAFGIKTYRVGFGKGKALFQNSCKKIMPFEEGDKVFFTGDWLSEKIFMIDNIRCISSEREIKDGEDVQVYRQDIIRQ